MKIAKKFTHYWFVIVSVLSFLAGWGMLAHSLKPVTASQTTAINTSSLPALPPIQAFGPGTGTSSGLNLITPSTSQSNVGFPRLRTGGS
jgi:hypothetical protein